MTIIRKKHNIDDLQKFPRNEKVGAEDIVDIYAMHNLLGLLSTYLKIKKPFLLNSCKHAHEK